MNKKQIWLNEVEIKHKGLKMERDCQSKLQRILRKRTSSQKV